MLAGSGLVSRIGARSPVAVASLHQSRRRAARDRASSHLRPRSIQARVRWANQPSPLRPTGPADRRRRLRRLAHHWCAAALARSPGSAIERTRSASCYRRSRTRTPRKRLSACSVAGCAAPLKHGARPTRGNRQSVQWSSSGGGRNYLHRPTVRTPTWWAGSHDCREIRQMHCALRSCELRSCRHETLPRTTRSTL